MGVLKVTGKGTSFGQKHFTNRMTDFPDVLKEATGEELFTGTLNVDVGRGVLIREHFRIQGTRIKEPHQDLLFEVCRINGSIWGYRIRPYDVMTGAGGHGDHIIEITSSTCIPNASPGSTVTIEFFR
jgi:hypothetical protein